VEGSWRKVEGSWRWVEGSWRKVEGSWRWVEGSWRKVEGSTRELGADGVQKRMLMLVLVLVLGQDKVVGSFLVEDAGEGTQAEEGSGSVESGELRDDDGVGHIGAVWGWTCYWHHKVDDEDEDEAEA
jgi:hypothetical protein